MCLMLGAYLFSTDSVKNRLWANALLAVGLFTKFVPILMYPWILRKADGVPWWKQHGVLIVLAILQIFYAFVNLPGAIWAVQYHSQRTIDAFGVYGVVAIALGKFRISPEQVKMLNATASVIGPVSNIFKVLSTLLILAAFGYATACYRKNVSKGHAQAGLQYGWMVGAFCVLSFMLLGKLGQPNYSVWLLACVAIMSFRSTITLRDQIILAVATIAFCGFAGLQGREAIFVQTGEKEPTILMIYGAFKCAFAIPIFLLALREIKQPMGTAVGTILSNDSQSAIAT